MASASEPQQMFVFPFNSISKRKLEPEDSSISLVQENGIFIPRNQKRQRFNGECEERQQSPKNSLYLPQNTNLCDQQIYNNMVDTEMEDEVTMDMTDNMSGTNTDCSRQIDSEDRGDSKATNGSSFNHFKRPGGFNCTAPVVHSYCFDSGLLDNLIMNYHGI